MYQTNNNVQKLEKSFTKGVAWLILYCYFLILLFVADHFCEDNSVPGKISVFETSNSNLTIYNSNLK
jgi:hypothetical protein